MGGDIGTVTGWVKVGSDVCSVSTLIPLLCLCFQLPLVKDVPEDRLEILWRTLIADSARSTYHPDSDLGLGFRDMVVLLLCEWKDGERHSWNGTQERELAQNSQLLQTLIEYFPYSSSQEPLHLKLSTILESK